MAQGVVGMTGHLFDMKSGPTHALSFFNTQGHEVAALFKAAAHGVSRALIAKAQGQKMSSAFWSGFAASAFSVGSRGFGGRTNRTLIMATVGGTVSQLTGGKFANGAVTGAFVHLFNAENIIKSTFSSLGEYFSGKGDMVELGAETKKELRNSDLIKNQSIALQNGTARHRNGNLSVNLTGDTFHVGRTGVVFNTICSGSSCTTGYVGFIQAANGGSVASGLDSFSDPIGLGIEVWGGTPYSYMPYSWTETYENKF